MNVMLLGNVFVDAMLKVLRSELFVVFVILAVGYLVGRITIKGVSFGSSGVFLVALLAGILLYLFGEKLGYTWISGENAKGEIEYHGGVIGETLKNLGLAMFVTSVGFIAGPRFLRNFKKKALSYVAIGFVVIAAGLVLCVAIGFLDKGTNRDTLVGVLMGALTSTPGLGSAGEVFDKAYTSAGYGMAYPFGVLGVVLFVQLIPKLKRANMPEEVQKLKALSETKKEVKYDSEGEPIEEEAQAASDTPAKKRFVLDSLGFGIFALAVALGMILGALTIPLGPSAKFSLGTTGGALFMGLIFGHLGRIGRLSLDVPKQTLNNMRELGLVLFLTGSGIQGGLQFLDAVKPMLFVYGVILTVIPMLAGYLVAVLAFKLDLLNALGSVCGGMTSTPALGSLIHVSGTDDVAQSYAATYPVALLLLVLLPQILGWIF